MKGDKPKWALTFTLIGISTWWFSNGHSVDTGFSGMLLTLTPICIQYWMRKKPSEPIANH